MIPYFKRLPMARQIFVIAACLCACVFAAMTVFVSISSEKSALRQTEAALKEQLKLVIDSMEYVYHDHASRARRNLATLRKLAGGDIVAAGTTLNQGGNELPVLKAGNEVLNGNPRLMPEFARLTGVDGAILVRKGDDFYRASTMLKDKDGKSMEGTPLPGGEPTVVALRKGEPYEGLLVRNDRYYMSRMEPITNGRGEVIGAITVRVDLGNDIEKLKAWMKSIKVGKTGYLFAFTPLPGNDIARYVLHPANEGRKVGDGNDEAQKRRVSEVIATKGGTQLYDWPDKASGTVKPKISVYGLAPDWNWIIGTGSFVEEFVAESVALRNALIVMSVIAGLFTIGLLYVTVTLRLKPMMPALAAIESIGQGDLTAATSGEPDARSRNEIDRLAVSVKQTGRQIGGLIEGISGSMHQLSSAATQLDESSRQASQAAQAQGDATSGMAAAVEELTVSIGHIADSAREADAISRAAREASGTGAKVVGEALTEMRDIATALEESSSRIATLGESSQRIVGIIAVISEIAEKTNLLALNAAIEAARAGEQGRGFAVVADEVRQLAERTSRSTRDIETMIATVHDQTRDAVGRMQALATRMQGGMDRAQVASQALTEIAGHADRTVSAVQEIASATEEQRQASTDISRSVERIAQMTEENSAVTAQNTAAAASLVALAGTMRGMVQRFRLS